MDVIPIPAFTDNYIWLIRCPKLNVFDCVDPGDAEPVIDYANSSGLALRAILLTHHHQDHIGGVGKLMAYFPKVAVYGPEDVRIPHAHTVLHGDDTVTLSPYTYRTLFNPGHTSTHISYYEATQGWLFCGDTLFSGGCGRVFDGTVEQLHHAMTMFKNLPPSTHVFCAHEYTAKNLRFAKTVEPDNAAIAAYAQRLAGCSLPSTIALEKTINPFLRTETPAVKAYALQHGANADNSLEVFRTLRMRKDAFT